MNFIIIVTLILFAIFVQRKLTSKEEVAKGPALIVSTKGIESRHDNPSLILLEKKLCEMKSGQGHYIIFETPGGFMQTHLDHSKDEEKYYHVEYKLDSMSDYLYQSKERVTQDIMLNLFRKFQAKDNSYQNDIIWEQFDL